MVVHKGRGVQGSDALALHASAALDWQTVLDHAAVRTFAGELCSWARFNQIS